MASRIELNSEHRKNCISSQLNNDRSSLYGKKANDKRNDDRKNMATTRTEGKKGAHTNTGAIIA